MDPGLGSTVAYISLPWETKFEIPVNIHSHLRKKESESPSKLLNLAELLDIVTKIIQGNRMSFSFLMSLGGEPFVTF